MNKRTIAEKAKARMESTSRMIGGRLDYLNYKLSLLGWTNDRVLEREYSSLVVLKRDLDLLIKKSFKGVKR